jgi:two-component system, probable response regulator PhcQ
MNNYYDYRKFAVLYVEDEDKARKQFVQLFEDRFRILTAANAQDALAILQEKHGEIGLLLTDQRMPGEKGVWLLEKARQLQPRIIRILVTAYADMDAAIAAVNTGSIYKYISKPWREEEMETALRRGLEFFLVQRERDQLLHEKLSVLHNMMIADRIVSLGLLAAGLSHHIRNSLVAVKTFLDLAPGKMAEEKADLQGLRDPDFWKDYYQNVQVQINKINGLLTDLRSASEKLEGRFSDSVRLRPVIEQSLREQQAVFTAKKLAVELAIPEDLPEIKVEKAKFYKLFELIFKDEAVSLPQGSEVRVSARMASAVPGERAAIEVVIQDNGPGLPAEALRLVFDPFAMRSDSPAEYGINLMACFFIVHHHGGRIEATSNDGKGTKFTIRLPLDPVLQPPVEKEDRFFEKVVLTDSLWEKLMTSV